MITLELWWDYRTELSSQLSACKEMSKRNNFVVSCFFSGDGGSSRESLANLLADADEGLGTSLDGTDELCTPGHPNLGRNDSGKWLVITPI